MDDLFKPTLYPQKSTVSWLKGGADGEFVYLDPSVGLIIEHIETNEQQILVSGLVITGPDGHPVTLTDEVTISPDRKFIMVPSLKEKLWRHSYKAEYVIYDVIQKRSFYLTSSGAPASTQVARWSTLGHNVAFVRENDLYVVVDWVETRVTFDGSPSVLNGVPDWVYEEEVLATNYAFYWSQDGDSVTWLKFNDTSVPVYNYAYYFDSSQKKDSAYPSQIPVRYPKPGYSNPIVSLHIYSISRTPAPSERRPIPAIKFPTTVDFGSDMIYGSIFWVGPTLLVKVLNRIQNVQKTVAIEIFGRQLRVEVVRERLFSDSWIEIHHQVTPCLIDSTWGYLDIIDVEGFNHLVWYETARSRDPIILSKGVFEVTAIKGIDASKSIAYIMTTQQGPSLRSLAKVSVKKPPPSIPAGVPELVDPTSPPGFYTTQFSGQAKFFVLSYEGPLVPWQSIRKTNDASFRQVLHSNDELNKTLSDFALPRSDFVEIPLVDSDNQEFTASSVIHYPPDFNPKNKYPVLMRVYGGPNSQLVQQKFDLDIHTFFASTRGIVCVSVDGRGTGFRGRKFRSVVYKRLGEVEADDQVSAARWLGQQAWVDSSKIGIWGWSYGGYLSCKVAEKNSGLFSFAIAVAPVTDWRFYGTDCVSFL
jgi:dipeptidyl aminopeptidase/acylaminoacyl peptidase